MFSTSVSLVFSNACRVLSQCKTKLLYLLNILFPVSLVIIIIVIVIIITVYLYSAISITIQ